MLNDTVRLLLLVLLLLHIPIHLVLSSCRSSCSNIPITNPFGIDDGCGSPDYRHMLDCYVYDSGHKEGLFLRSPSGDRWVRIQSIDYSAGTMIVFDQAGMSTCSDLQPASSTFPQLESAFITPSPGNGLFLMNCSLDSPLADKAICFQYTPGGHSCYELYKDCSSFNVLAGASTIAPPPCCFTTYDIVKNLSLKDELMCSHYASVYDAYELEEGDSPLDWPYGMKLSFLTPAGCADCQNSGGTCGYEVDTLCLTCLCNPTVNSTTECAPGTVPSKKNKKMKFKIKMKKIFWSSTAKSIYVGIGIVSSVVGTCLTLTLIIKTTNIWDRVTPVNNITERSEVVRERVYVILTLPIKVFLWIRDTFIVLQTKKFIQ